MYASPRKPPLQQLAEIKTRLQNLEAMNRTRQEDVALLLQYLGLSPSPTSSTNSGPGDYSSMIEALSPEAKLVLENSTISSVSPSNLRMSTAFHFLPHLLDDPISLKPSFLMSKGRTGVSIILGVPTVKHDKETHLMSTLESLITSMNEGEQNETLIVVFIGETDMDYISLTAKQIEVRFGSYIESGLIDVVAPSLSYYPKFNKLERTLNDPLEPVQWTSKQNLDYAFLMAYAQSKGIFYVQLKDDILSKPGFLTNMKQFTIDKTAERHNWIVLDFCDLGFIGKMFKSADLPWLITFFQMFYNEKPADLLLDDFLKTKSSTWNKCQKARIDTYWFHYEPSIFERIGVTSTIKDYPTEQTISQCLADNQTRLQHLESVYKLRQEDMVILSQYCGLSQNSTTLSPEARLILNNFHLPPGSPPSLRMPTVFQFLPHLLDDPNSLKPSFLMSKGRTGMSIVLGVPTVKRERQSYLVSTLRSLITNMDEAEQNETLIVVFIGETDKDYISQTVKKIEECFGLYIENGLIDIVAPFVSYYPNFDKLPITLNDPIDRVKWRSKQSLDYAFLMAYAQPKGTFYVQLEDDIQTKRGFVTDMKKFAIERTAKADNWLLLDFCELGFIGNLFKSADLPWLITFFQMFYNDQPVDWLLNHHFIPTKTNNCHKACKFSLFQHVGINSSLYGKEQKLKDSQFGSIPSFFPHYNPLASVKTSIAPYQKHDLNKAYEGEGGCYFWTKRKPKPGDMVQFVFSPPISLKRYLFRSGNAEYPSDIFCDTTVEVLPDSLTETSPIWTTYKSTTDGYLIMGGFDVFGLAEGPIDPEIGTIKEIRLNVHSDAEYWAILSEIHLQETT